MIKNETYTCFDYHSREEVTDNDDSPELLLLGETSSQDQPDLIPEGITLRDFDDHKGLRENVFAAAQDGFAKKFPQEYGKFRLEVDNLHYAEKDDFDLATQKKALMTNQFLAKRLRGTLRLYDRETGDLVDEQEKTLMRVPYVTDRGTTIHNGNEYVTLNQARLSSGIYTRRKESGEVEAQINAKRGTGKAYRIRLEPESSLYKMDLDQSSLRLYSLLHDLGVSDEELELRWGSEVLEANRKKYDPRVLDKAYSKLVRNGDPGAGREDKIKAIREALTQTRVSRKSVERTLPNLFNTKQATAWRKAGFSAQVDQAAQNQDEFVKWDQKRQEQEMKAQQQQQKAEAKQTKTPEIQEAEKESQTQKEDAAARMWKNHERKIKRYRMYVASLEHNILIAHKKGNEDEVKRLTKQLISSTQAKVLAVWKVTNSNGSETPGTDGETWVTSSAKWEGVLALSEQGYQAKPLRRIEVPKPDSNKKRPLSMPTIRDKAMQELFRLALDPIAEHLADPNSYGFRKHRSVQDAIEQIRTVLSPMSPPEIVLDADIQGCFDNIDHDWLIKNIPIQKDILSQWLKCGYVDTDGKHHPTDAGTPQGGVISPSLCNMTLDGLEKIVKQAAGPGNKVYFVRYADDFLVLVHDKLILEQSIIPAIRVFLNERGLNLSDQKTSIRHIDEGVDFLGQNVRRINGKIIVTPSQKNVSNVLAKIREIISSPDMRDLETLLVELNPVITGWANCHRHVEAMEQYVNVDVRIQIMVLRFLKRLYRDKSVKWIKANYYRKNPNMPGGGTFFVPIKELNGEHSVPITLYKASSIRKTPYIKIKAKANPYDLDQQDYFLGLINKRKSNKDIESKTAKCEWVGEQSTGLQIG